MLPASGMLTQRCGGHLSTIAGVKLTICPGTSINPITTQGADPEAAQSTQLQFKGADPEAAQTTQLQLKGADPEGSQSTQLQLKGRIQRDLNQPNYKSNNQIPAKGADSEGSQSTKLQLKGADPDASQSTKLQIKGADSKGSQSTKLQFKGSDPDAAQSTELHLNGRIQRELNQPITDEKCFFETTVGCSASYFVKIMIYKETPLAFYSTLSFVTVYCFICCCREMAVTRHRMICHLIIWTIRLFSE